MHSTDDLDDGYFGSGKLITRSVKKHGLDLHKKEILEFLDSRIALKERERQLVTEEIVNDPLCMNLQLGGGGGCTEEIQQIRSSAGGKAAWFKEDSRKILLKHCSNRMKQHHIDGKIHYDNFKGKSHSAKSIAKMMETRKGFQSGDKNSQYGVKRIGINKEGRIKKILPIEVQQYLENGWSIGFNPPTAKIPKPRASKRNWSSVICQNCNSAFEASQRDIRRNRKYCSLSCSNKSKKEVSS